MIMGNTDECPCGADCARDPEEEPVVSPTAAPGKSEGANVLQEICADGVNGFTDEAEEWEEVEFLVDSGASATVVGEDTIKAVKASSPEPFQELQALRWEYHPKQGGQMFQIPHGGGLRQIPHHPGGGGG